MKTHWKKLTNPNYLGSYAFQPGEEIIATIKKVENEKVKNQDGKEEVCLVAHFKEDKIKPLILNKTNAKMIAKVHGTPYIEEWPGKSIQLYVSKVRAFGETVDAVRVRDLIPKVAKQKLDPKRFEGAKASIDRGDITLEALKQRFDLTPEQLKQLTK